MAPPALAQALLWGVVHVMSSQLALGGSLHGLPLPQGKSPSLCPLLAGPGVGTRGIVGTGNSGLSLPESGGLKAAGPLPQAVGTQHGFLSSVLRGLIKVKSPHLEELLTALFSATSAVPTSRPIMVVSSLLLQEEEEPPAPGEQDADGCR